MAEHRVRTAAAEGALKVKLLTGTVNASVPMAEHQVRTAAVRGAQEARHKTPGPVLVTALKG
jgi:uncharacterized protein YbjT (DUF2867 family)